MNAMQKAQQRATRYTAELDINDYPQTARFKAELIFNPQLLTSRYLAAYDNLSAITASCQAVKTEAEARQIFERYGVFFLATLSVEIDRFEHMIQAAYPEFAYIDIEVL